MDQKFLSIDFDSWSELSGSLMAQKVTPKNPSSACKCRAWCGSGTYIGLRLAN